MATEADPVIEILRRYIDELEKNQIFVSEAILFGSYAKGTAKQESDIDVALISTFFKGDRFDDRRLIVPLRRKIDNKIEPIPFRPEDFDAGGTLVDEIKKTGITILKR